jgi:hypothetical protein
MEPSDSDIRKMRFTAANIHSHVSFQQREKNIQMFSDLGEAIDDLGEEEAEDDASAYFRESPQ